MNKRAFNGIEQPVANKGFPETSFNKWMPEGAELMEIEEKHLTIRLPDLMLQNDSPDVLDAAYLAWKDAIPLNESKGEKKKKEQPLHSEDDGKRLTLTSIMQRVMAYPIESKSPLESIAIGVYYDDGGYGVPASPHEINHFWPLPQGDVFMRWHGLDFSFDNGLDYVRIELWDCSRLRECRDEEYLQSEVD